MVIDRYAAIHKMIIDAWPLELGLNKSCVQDQDSYFIRKMNILCDV